MSDCHLFEEGGRRHFMTRRFDRTTSGEKLHMQSLGAMAHFDFNQAGMYDSEQAFQVMRKLDLDMDQIEQQFRRMLFNIAARNPDDHVKKIAFLMDKTGRWSLAPPYDVTYSYNPTGDWTGVHQMRMNGKRDQFDRQDIVDCGKTVGLKRGRAETILRNVQKALFEWPKFAETADIAEGQAVRISRAFRFAN